jgi:hypothetical protein
MRPHLVGAGEEAEHLQQTEAITGAPTDLLVRCFSALPEYAHYGIQVMFANIFLDLRSSLVEGTPLLGRGPAGLGRARAL